MVTSDREDTPEMRLRRMKNRRIAIKTSVLLFAFMVSPQLSVRSARARDLAHKRSQREKRPIHAIVEDALTEYTNRHP